MKIKHPKILLFAAVFVLIMAVLAGVFYIRSPALVVTDASFIALYGAGRARQRQALASLALFRRVKPVTVADGAGSDVLVLALEGAAAKPYCVLFPYRYAEAAQRYHGQFPDIPAAILAGRAGNGSPGYTGGTEGLPVYATDRETDWYRAGVCAGILAARPPAPPAGAEDRDGGAETGAGPGKAALFQAKTMQPEEREAFSRGLRETCPEAVPLFFNTAGQLSDTNGVACVVMAGGGADYPDRNLKIPVILFSWLNPSLTARETVLVFDDSPWAVAVPAATLAVNRQAEEKIPSKILFFPARIADKGIFRKIKKAVGKW